MLRISTEKSTEINFSSEYVLRREQTQKAFFMSRISFPLSHPSRLSQHAISSHDYQPMFNTHEKGRKTTGEGNII
jgi:hypothetical protein